MGTKVTSWEGQGNVHIDINQPQKPLAYHDVISDIAIKYSLDNTDILDVGCGVGQISSQIQGKGKRHIYIADAYEECLEKTNNIVATEGSFLLSENDFNVVEKIERQFDVVILSHVLEHLLDPVRAVRDLSSLVKPNGVLILAVPNPGRPSVFFGNIRRNHYVNRGHVVCWDMSHWRNFLENIMSLDVIEYHSDIVTLPGWKRFSIIKRIGMRLASLLPWLGFSNIAVIRIK